MPYDFQDPNFDFAGQEEIVIRALRDAARQRATPFNQGVHAGNTFTASGADPGAFLSRAAGMINQQRAEQQRGAMNTEQMRRYDDLSRQLSTPGEVDYSDPNSMVADNARRMQLAGQMGNLTLPQAQKMAQAYLTKGVNFPEAMAKMQSDRIERGEQNAMRLQEIEAQKKRDAANQLIRDRERAQDRQDNIRLAASLRPGPTPPSELDIQLKEERLKQLREGKPPTESERLSAGYLGRMQEAEKNLTNAPPLDVLRQKGLETAPSLTNAIMSEQQQVIRQQQEDWVRAKLRKESGAVIGDQEMAREIRTYFPQAYDKPDVIRSKAQSRAQALEQLRTGAGRAVPTIAAPVQFDTDKEQRYQEWKARQSK